MAAQAVKLRQFEAFLAIAEERHFGRAAARLGVAQPALSQQIQALERTLGVVLFERTNRSVKLSAAGVALAPSVRRSLDAAAQAVLEAQRFQRGRIGAIEVSYSASVAYTGVLQDVVGGYRQAFPDVRLEIRELLLKDQVKSLNEGRVDIAFLRPEAPDSDGLESHVILREEIVLLLPSTHRLAGAASIDLAECRAETFIVPQQPHEISFHKHTIDICAGAGFTPKTGPRVRDWVTIASMVALGMGVAIAPASLACVGLPGVALCRLEGVSTRAEIALAHRSGDQTPVVSAFLQHVLPRFAV